MTGDGRAVISAAKQLVVKIGSSSLTTLQGDINEARIAELADVLAARTATGTKVVLVSSGATAAGLPVLGLTRRPRQLAAQQAAASVGQGLLMARYMAAFASHGLRAAQLLLTVDDLMHRVRYRNAQRTLQQLLYFGVMPVVNENDTVATERLRFGDNDRLAALVAHVLRADALLLLSDVDALYDGQPGREGARRITEVRSQHDLAGVRLGRADPNGVGSGGMATKVEAAFIAATAGIPTVVAAAADVRAALAGSPTGTYFVPDQQRPSSRLLWLAHATVGRGQLTLDAGAVEAVTARRASLLPAGITAVSGRFEVGDPVDVCDESGRLVARGLVSYDAAEIPRLMGRSTHWLVRENGHGYHREVIHRDAMVVLTGP
ncbi:glutamate 5-kinase [Streptomyces albidoflavus]|uniref:glutamate 5-kinase n=1 Tax=Streptomyces albidoflavus TaxID=1886 RepID=UPI00101E6AD4|nr:glutamate 5-kinase [Streptomyces albidoflavus]RZD76776.1 glutamate 5-kinase [Streptomyces albidoflavus]